MGYGKCGVLQLGGNNLCVQRLACRDISASAELNFLLPARRSAGAVLAMAVCRCVCLLQAVMLKTNDTAGRMEHVFSVNMLSVDCILRKFCYP